MKTTTLLCTLLILFASFSFTKKESSGLITGTYGVCSSGNEMARAQLPALVLNDDLTFLYTGLANDGTPFSVTGNWFQKDNTILLDNYIAESPIHHKWKIDRNEKCLKSRMGLHYTRLCNLKACK